MNGNSRADPVPKIVSLPPARRPQYRCLGLRHGWTMRMGPRVFVPRHGDFQKLINYVNAFDRLNPAETVYEILEKITIPSKKRATSG
jgi:hypothetical protein